MVTLTLTLSLGRQGRGDATCGVEEGSCPTKRGLRTRLASPERFRGGQARWRIPKMLRNILTEKIQPQSADESAHPNGEILPKACFCETEPMLGGRDEKVEALWERWLRGFDATIWRFYALGSFGFVLG